MKRWRDWFELCRFPTLVAAMADPLAGALIVGAGWKHTGHVVAVMLASACLYAGGVILNDVHDVKEDRVNRPTRPLPAGRVRRIHAVFVAIVLLGLAGLLGTIPGAGTTKVVGLLIVAVVLYNVLFKDVPIAPGIRATCRVLNLLLGMVIVTGPTAPIDLALWLYLPTAIGVYMLGVAIFDQADGVPRQRKRLLAGSSVTWAGILMVGGLRVFHRHEVPHAAGIVWVAILMLVVGYRMTQAALTPEPARVGRAVKTALLGMVLFDAAMVTLIRGPLVSLLVVPLLAPAVWLDRRLHST